MRASKSNLDMRGTKIGPYRIVSLLGQGGIGTVYLVKNENTGSLEALKLLLPRLTGSKETKERFEREIENSRNLHHPNIVKLKDYGKAIDISYYTMEYCRGGSLKDLIMREGAISADKACAIIMQVLDGLEYAHNVEIPHVKMSDGSWNKGNGLIHRDIKPENILMDKSGKMMRVKITDFGLAKTYRFSGKSGNTQTGSVGGSMSFICRQQLLNYKYSKPEVDVWSTVAVLYFLLSGKTPRKIGDEKNPFNSILKNNPIPIRHVNPAVPEKLASVIDKALDDSSLLCYKKASDLKHDIGQFQV